MTWLNRVAMLACVVPIAVASGSTGTEVLESGDSAFTISVDVVNPETRHDFALFSISAINLLPNDPSDDARGSIEVFASVDDQLDIDLNDLARFDPATIRLAKGSYRIDRLEITNFQFVDFQAPIPSSSCAELLQYPAVSMPVAITSDDLGDTNLTVTEGGTGRMTITIDGAAMVEAFESAWTDCDRNGLFDAALFAGTAPAFITLR